ncbi:MAG: hypothetical protein AB2693_33685, partial [Candidatus Thiodiazotropha sp.]
INHCVSSHDEELLKYRQLVLCEQSGRMKYQTKIHEDLVPRKLHDAGKTIQVRDKEVFVFDSKSKKKKLNTPVKGKEVRRTLTFDLSHSQERNEHGEIQELGKEKMPLRKRSQLKTRYRTPWNKCHFCCQACFIPFKKRVIWKVILSLIICWPHRSFQ